MTQTMIAKLERGARPTPVEEAQIFAQVLGVPIGALVGEAEAEPDLTKPLLDAVAEVHRRQAGLIAAADELARARERLDDFHADVAEVLSGFNRARLHEARRTPAEVLEMRAAWRGESPGEVAG